MIRKVVSLALVLSTTLAAADPHHVLVLKTEGTADAATRAKIDAAVLKLAKDLEGQVTAGDISFEDAVTAIGCKAEAQVCKDEVLATLAVDEVVVTTATRKPDGIDVTVRRIAKGTPQREGSAQISGDGAPQLEALGTMFGTQAHVDKPPIDKPPEPAVPDQPTPVVPAPVDTPQPTPQPVVDEPRSRLVYAGMIGGPALIVLGFVLWGEASSTQDQINSAPTKTKQDIQNLQNLESQGRSQAGGGNLLFAGGVLIAGVSAYFFFRDRHRAAATQARITPAVFDHGAGVTLTIGGSP